MHHERELDRASQPRTPSSKPRAGRKRWALAFGSKTGSLKSVKSDDGGGHAAASPSSSSFGGMLATLHGLARSRPDLLSEADVDFRSSSPRSRGSNSPLFSLPSRLPREEMGSRLRQKLETEGGGEILREFERIPKKRVSSMSLQWLSELYLIVVCIPQADCNFRTAMLVENIPRSRFRDVLPYEENRVRLAAGDKDNRGGFINASHVSATVGRDQRFYIAAQSPLPHTVQHFWQMILQCDVHLVVMLADVGGGGGGTGGNSANASSVPYWPQKKGSTLELGDFTVVKKFSSESVDGAYVTSTLQMTHGPTKSKRTIWHLQYTDWSDHGCPSDVRRYLDFLEELSALRSHAAASSDMPVGSNRNPPVLVHCSAGVGRSGVTVLSDILLHCLDHNLDVDVPKVLGHLRQQRMLMVQTLAQYKFVHTVLIHYLRQSRLI